MQFTTPLQLSAAPFALQPTDDVLFLGSCFADNIGSRLAAALPAAQVCINPFGTLYDERSLHRAVQLLRGATTLSDSHFFQAADGLWHCWLTAGETARPSREDCVATVHKALQQGQEALARCKMLVLTLSTPRYYQLRRVPMLAVANCHKQPRADFEECCDSHAERTSRWRSLLTSLLADRPDLHVVLTLSPFRYVKYGLHASQVEKAKLLLLLDELEQMSPRIHYFPAYEILLDELRDYRFYAPDMLHPSPQAVDYIGEHFEQWCFAPALHAFARERRQLLAELAHRPLHPDSPAHQLFLQRLAQRIARFRQQWGAQAI